MILVYCIDCLRRAIRLLIIDVLRFFNYCLFSSIDSVSFWKNHFSTIQMRRSNFVSTKLRMIANKNSLFSNALVGQKKETKPMSSPFATISLFFFKLFISRHSFWNIAIFWNLTKMKLDSVGFCTSYHLSHKILKSLCFIQFHSFKLPSSVHKSVLMYSQKILTNIKLNTSSEYRMLLE